MAGLLIIGAFVVVALGVFAVAMRSGPRAAPRRATPSRASRRLTALGIGAALLVFGLALPVLVGVYNADDQAQAGAGGTVLTAGEERGRALFRGACATCHTLRDAGAVGRVGPDLDVLRPARALTLNAIKLGRARGQGQMPALLYEGQEAEDVAGYVERVAGR